MYLSALMLVLVDAAAHSTQYKSSKTRLYPDELSDVIFKFYQFAQVLQRGFTPSLQQLQWPYGLTVGRVDILQKKKQRVH